MRGRLDPGEASGEKHVRQILRGLLLVAFVVLASVTIYVFLKKPRLAYFTWVRRADLIYLSIWLGITAMGVVAASRRKSVALAFGALLLLAAESLSNLYVYHRDGRLYQPAQPDGWGAFQPHPLLVGIPKAGVFDGVVHTADNRRRTVNEGKVANPKYIFAFGASTTYDIGVNDDAQTWPSDLSRLLGEDFAVENLGVPGYSSVETMIQSLFAFREVKPVCAIYFLGTNDLRNANIRGLRPDYSDFHLPTQREALSLSHHDFFLNNLLFLKLLVSLILGDSGIKIEGAPSDRMDPRVSALFTENMELIGEIGRHFGVKVLFVSQVANYSNLTADRVRGGWLPFVRDKDVKPMMQALDRDMQLAAAASGAIYLGAPQAENWTAADFFDSMHFTAEGSQKFARSLAKDIAGLCD
jgi:lysophospholipase L1-like esterase